jgi:hypothetical protein
MICRVNVAVKIPHWTPRAQVTLIGDLSSCGQNLTEGTVTFHKPGRLTVSVISGGDMWQGEIIAEGEPVAVEQPVEPSVEQPVEQSTEQPAEQPTVVAEVVEEKTEEAQEPEHSEETPTVTSRRVGRFDRYAR